MAGIVLAFHIMRQAIIIVEVNMRKVAPRCPKIVGNYKIKYKTTSETLIKNNLAINVLHSIVQFQLSKETYLEFFPITVIN